ncbi:MAG: formate dehydrogenase, partial [bacterium]|nr:formate dehydrogenase [bacterium]
KMEFYSGEAAGKGFTPLPVHRDLVFGEGEFILLNSATRNYTHSQFRESYGPIPAFVRINPGDAKELGIVDGDEVRLFNRLGSIRVKAEISSSVPGGTLWCPRQLTGLDGVTLNTLTSGKPQLLGNGPTFNSTRVKIVRQEVDKTK